MIDYKKLYFILFNAITDALGCPDFDQAKSLLIDAQLSAEDEYMSFDEEEAAKGAFEESERLRDVLIDYSLTCPQERIDVERIDKIMDAIDQADEYCRRQKTKQ